MLFWIQPAAVFAVYYHYFHGHGAVLASCANDPARDAVVRLPGMPPLKPRALPTIVSLTSPGQQGYPVLGTLRDLFLALDEDRPTKVLVNTFDALEPEALRAVPELELVAVGPVVPDISSSPSSTDLSLCDEDSDGYMEWLDTQAARSVVYVSFGTIFTASKRQELETLQGLKATGRPYLAVLRKVADEGAALDGTNGGGASADGRQGMVVEWCDQARVLSHPAVGCFVTHCGWNSALESIASGVPIVAVPQWTDQPTVAWLVEECAGVGVRVEVDDEGVAERSEIQRCVETVMGNGYAAVEIRASAMTWMERAKEAIRPPRRHRAASLTPAALRLAVDGCRPRRTTPPPRPPPEMPSYVVYKGRVPGVYANWEDCWIQVYHFRSCIYTRYNTMQEVKARYAYYLAGERREMRRNRMKTAFVLMLLIVTAFFIYVILV